LNDPALRYNFNERTTRYQEIKLGSKKVKEIESHLKIHI